MATTKKSGKKGGGAAKKGGSKKRSSKKGGSLSSVLSRVGSIAGAVGAVAGAAGGHKGELRVAAPRDASFNEIVTSLRRKFKEAGCPGCRSGFDRFVFEDIVGGRGR